MRKETLGSNFIADPLLADPAHGDFHILPNSPCIDRGALIEDLKTDFEGDPRGIQASSKGTAPYYDIGADEYTTVSRHFTYPNQPKAKSPIDEEVYSTVTLRISPFEHPDPSSKYLATIWQVSTRNDLHDWVNIPCSGDKPDELIIPRGVFEVESKYYWRARYVDDHFGISDWSSPATFRYVHTPPIHVPSDHPTIQSAIDAAVKDDTIEVAPGTYYENLKLKGVDIILRSSNPLDPAIVNSTIIDGRKLAPVITLTGAEHWGIIEGFTITHGKGIEGGGICLSPDSTYTNSFLTIRYNKICDNEAVYGGGAARITPIGNIIVYNTASKKGGGIWNCGAVRSNVIAWNVAVGENMLTGEGGGCADCYLTYNTIYGNSASFGGGGLSNCDVIEGCIVWNNYAPRGAQLFNTSSSHSCIMGNGDSYSKNDPLFASPERGDFHLMPNSPCIDRSNVNAYAWLDIDGNERPYAVIDTNFPYDLGADEYCPRFRVQGFGTKLLVLGEHPFSDLDLDFSKIPDSLNRQFFIQMRNDDEALTTFTLRIQLLTQSAIYVVMDQRVNPLPAWLKGWKQVDEELGIYGAVSGRTLFRKYFPAGEAVLGANSVETGPNAEYMYIPIIVPLHVAGTATSDTWLHE